MFYNLEHFSLSIGFDLDHQNDQRSQDHIVTLTKENNRLSTQCSEQWIQLDALHVDEQALKEKCGNFEEEISALKEKVTRLERKNQTLEQRCIDNGEEIRNANGKVQNLQQKLKTVNEENQHLQQEIDSMKKAKSKYRGLVCTCCPLLGTHRNLSVACFSTKYRT